MTTILGIIEKHKEPAPIFKQVPDSLDCFDPQYRCIIVKHTIELKIPFDAIKGLITCPISSCLFFSPILAADGFVYEEDMGTKIINDTNKSPLTNKEIDTTIRKIPLFTKLTKTLCVPSIRS